MPRPAAVAAPPAGACAPGRKHSGDFSGDSPRAAVHAGGPQQRVAGGSPRRLSAPELDVSSLVAALSAAAAAAELQQQECAAHNNSTDGTEPHLTADPAAVDGTHQQPQQQGQPAGRSPASHHLHAQAREDAARVLSLIRFPLLPIEQLHGCLADPLLVQLPAVLALVHEALDVHRRETGAVLAPPQHHLQQAPQQLLLLGEAAAGPAAAAMQGAPGAAATGGMGGVGAAAGTAPCGAAAADAACFAAAAGCAGAVPTGAGCAPLPGATLASAASMGCAAIPGSANGGAGSFSRSTSMPAPASERRLVKPLAPSGHSGSVATEGGGPGTPGPAGTPHPLQSPVKTSAAGGATGGSGAADGAAAAWSVRYQRRCLPFALELEYVCDGDSSGVLHFLGTQYGAQVRSGAAAGSGQNFIAQMLPYIPKPLADQAPLCVAPPVLVPWQLSTVLNSCTPCVLRHMHTGLGEPHAGQARGRACQQPDRPHHRPARAGRPPVRAHQLRGPALRQRRGQQLVAGAIRCLSVWRHGQFWLETTDSASALGAYLELNQGCVHGCVR